ncbi:FG-GAP repeat protein, partial [bacterium]|nr:FG-GAP repeat protein [bacterium]
FGLPVATAGDVNGDGYADLLVGALLYDHGESDEGAAFLYLGGPAGPGASPDWIGECNVATSYYGSSLGTAGDVNGDGYDDVIVGAPQYTDGQTFEGAAFVYSGGPAGLSDLPLWIAESDQAVAHLGAAVAGAGDVNGDGYADVVVGAPLYDDGQSNEGKAFVYLGGPLGPSATPDWSAHSGQALAQFGASVATAGDVDGDGYADVAIGVPFWDDGQTDEGGVFVYEGDASGLDVVPRWIGEGGQTSALYGCSVATAGDVNGDGYSDAIIGAYQYDSGQLNEGAAFIYAGAAFGLSIVATWENGGPNQMSSDWGAALAWAGDVNGDGYSDLLISAPYYTGGYDFEGIVALYPGSADGPSTTPAWIVYGDQYGAELGLSVASAGDVNGDGYADVILGAPGVDTGNADAGQVFVYYGSSAGLSSTPDWTAVGDRPQALFGASVSTAGDVNGDGYADVIIGASEFPDGQFQEGGAFVYLGSATGLADSPAWSVESDLDGAHLGCAVSTAGDVNGDGYSDVIVGAQDFSSGVPNEGRAFLYLGSAAGPSPSYVWFAEGGTTGAQFGHAVASAGDVNGDGYADVAIGAPGYTSGQSGEGAVFVYLGSAGGLPPTPSWSMQGDQVDAEYGFAVASAGDVNGDGFSDLAVGARSYLTGGAHAGWAFVYQGSVSGLGATSSWSVQSGQPAAELGAAIAGAGDANGDGYGDLVLGAPAYDYVHADDGRVYFAQGNGAGGVPRRPRQFRTDDTAPIASLGSADSGHLFRVKVEAGTPAGRGRVRMQVEVKPAGTPFDGGGLQTGPIIDTGFPGADGSTTRLSQLVDGLVPSTLYHWRLRLLSTSPFYPRTRWYSPPANAPSEADLRSATSTGVAQSPGQSQPLAGRLSAPAPNPFTASTEFAFTLAEPTPGRLAVYDVAGRRVAVLADGVQEAGRHTLQWDGRDEHGATVPTGVYLLRFDAGGRVESRKLVRLR